jgi:acyl carrier protein
MNVETEVLDIIASCGKLDRSTLTRSSVLTELGIESIDVVDIIFTVEERLDVEIPFNANARGEDSGNMKFATAGDVIDGVQELVDAKARGGPAAFASA